MGISSPIDSIAEIAKESKCTETYVKYLMDTAPNESIFSETEKEFLQYYKNKLNSIQKQQLFRVMVVLNES